MRNKVTTRTVHELTQAAKARIVNEMRKGDQGVIADVVGTSPTYVKMVLASKRADKSPLARRIWLAANRITIDRNRLKGELGA